MLARGAVDAHESVDPTSARSIRRKGQSRAILARIVAGLRLIVRLLSGPFRPASSPDYA
jgi:hypothetical protein